VARKVADVAGLVVALVVAVAGIVLVIVFGPSFDPPQKATTVVERGVGPGLGKRTRTVEIEKSGDSTSGKKLTTTVETPSGRHPGKRTKTVEDAPRSFPERVLGESGLILLQAGIVLLAAFLAGAFVQRALLGDFSLKLGGVLELGAIQETTKIAEQTLVDLTAEVTTIKEAQADQAKGANVARELSETVGSQLTRLSVVVAQLNQRVEALEKGDEVDG
jgi:hypothetical protein